MSGLLSIARVVIVLPVLFLCSLGIARADFGGAKKAARARPSAAPITQATLSIESIDGLRQKQAQANGPVMAQAEVGSRTGATPPSNTLQSWTGFGARAVDDRLIYRDPEDFGRTISPDFSGISRALLALQLARDPSTADSVSNVYRLSELLTSAERISLFGSALIDSASRVSVRAMEALRRDPFRQRDIVRAFKEKFLPRIVAQSPQFPVKLRVRNSIQLANYNFATQSFPIAPGSATSSHFIQQGERGDRIHFYFVNSGEGSSIVTDLSALPKALPMADGAARSFNEKLQVMNFKLFMAIDMEIVGASGGYKGQGSNFGHVLGWGADIRVPQLQARVSAIQIYEDADLTRFVTRLPVERYSPKVAAPEPPDPLGGQPVSGLEKLTNWTLINLAQSLGAGDDFVARVIRRSPAYLSANEFDRASVENSLMQVARQATPKAEQAFYLPGSLTLGQHDGKGSFAVARSDLAVEVSAATLQPADKAVVLTIENPEMLARLPVNADTGRLMVERVPNRSFAALFRIIPVKATAIPRTRDEVQANLVVRIEEVILLHPKNADQAIVRFDAAAAGVATMAGQGSIPALQPPETVALAIKPDRVPLNDETMMLYVVKESGKEPTDATLRWLLLRRFEAEHDPYNNGGNHGTGDNGIRNAWGAFFPKGYRQLTDADVQRFTPAFRKWTALRIAALPSKATFYWHNRIMQDGNFGQRLRAHAPVLEKIGISRSEMAKSGASMQVVDRNGRKVFVGGVLSLNRGPATSAPDAYLHMPDLPAPDMAQGEYEMYVDFDARIVSEPGPQGLPLVAIDALPTEVRWWGDKTAVRPRQLLATLPVAPSTPRTALTDPVLDMAGLTIGMRMEQGEDLLAKHMPVGRILELQGRVDPVARIDTVSRLYVRQDGRELIEVVYGPGKDHRLLNAARYLYLKKEEPSLQALTNSFTQKYGPSVTPNDLVWGKTADIFPCAEPRYSNTHPWLSAKVIRGEPLGPNRADSAVLAQNDAIAAEFRTTRRIDFIPWSFMPQEGDISRCGPTIRARYSGMTLNRAGERIPEADDPLLITILMDHKAHADAVEAASASPADSNKEELPDVKL